MEPIPSGSSYLAANADLLIDSLLLTFALWMSAGISGPRAVPLTPVLHLGDPAAVLQRKPLCHRAAIRDDVAEGKVPGEGGFVEFLGLAQRGDLLVGEALHVVDAAEDALDRGVGVRYTG